MFTIFVVMVLTPYVTAFQGYAPALALQNVSSSKVREVPAQNGMRAYEECDLVFDIGYDLDETMKWTTKEVYLGLVAFWTDSAGPQEQTVWDKTVYYTDSASFRFSEQTLSKYPLRSYGDSLRGQQVQFKFVLYEVGFGGRFRKTYFDVPDLHLTVEEQK